MVQLHGYQKRVMVALFFNLLLHLLRLFLPYCKAGFEHSGHSRVRLQTTEGVVGAAPLAADFHFSPFCDVKTLNASFPASVHCCSVTRAQCRSVPLWLIAQHKHYTARRGKQARVKCKEKLSVRFVTIMQSSNLFWKTAG